MSDRYFDASSELPSDLAPSNTQVREFAGKHVRYGGDGKRWFDWASFKKVIYDDPPTNLVFSKFASITYAQEKKTIESAVDQIVKVLVDALDIVSTETMKTDLAATLETTYTNLEERSSRDFLDFRKSGDGHHSSWEYRIQFSFPNPDPSPDPHVPKYFYTLITTILLKANIVEKTGWWDLRGDTKKNFSTTVETMELVIKEGFEDSNA